MANWRIFRMRPLETEDAGEIVQIKFFVNQKGIVEQIYLIEKNGRKLVWDAGKTCDFADISDKRLNDVVHRLAFGNPEDFQMLYLILQASKQKRLWQCMQDKREEIRQLFEFS